MATGTPRSRVRVRALPPVASVGVYAGLQAAAGTVPWPLPLPAPLAAMLMLLTAMTAARALGASGAVDGVGDVVLRPGAGLLGKWLAVFFVPNLVMLPLAPAIPGADIVKVGGIVVVGFVFSLLSAAGVCLLLRAIVERITGRRPAKSIPGGATSAPPSTRLALLLAAGAAVALSLAAGSAVPTVAWKAYALVLTLLTFVVGQLFPRKLRVVVHPLVTCTFGTIAGMWLLGWVSGVGFTTSLASYYVRGAAFAQWGAGNLLAALCGPAIVTFAYQMDARRRLAASRAIEVVGTSIYATFAGLFGTAVVARLLKLSVPARILVLPRQVTAPLAIAIAEMLGANVALAASVVAMTGLLGANIGAAILSVLRVRDPVVRGLAVGAAAHGLGTAAMADEQEAFPFSALAMTLVGVFSTLLIVSPPIRALLLRVALGKLAGRPGAVL